MLKQVKNTLIIFILMAAGMSGGTRASETQRYKLLFRCEDGAVVFDRVDGGSSPYQLVIHGRNRIAHFNRNAGTGGRTYSNGETYVLPILKLEHGSSRPTEFFNHNWVDRFGEMITVNTLINNEGGTLIYNYRFNGCR